MSLFQQCGDKVAFGLFKMAKTLIEIDAGDTPINELVQNATGFSDEDTQNFLMVFDILLEKIPEEYPDGSEESVEDVGEDTGEPVWKITYSHLDEEEVDIYGPDGVTRKDTDRCILLFRMGDDDRNLYYTGYMSDNCVGTEPLDDFGMPNDGCTWIEMFENGEWVPV